ncbi:MAG: VWA domain-containing protein [Myxococcales bacterium]|nr:VWA domain-containing protein [Myxococcales bacterium]
MARLRWTSVPLTALLLVAALPFGACFEPRDPEVDFEEKTCGETSDNRQPSPAVESKTGVLSAAAHRLADGTIEVVIAPLVTGTVDIVADLDPASLEVRLDGQVTADFELDKVSQEIPAAVDIVFVLDTTGSMAWAIDGVKQGIDLFLDGLDATGIDAQVGGIEFGDGIRSDVELGTTDDLRHWLDLLTATGGGDGPENPLDSMEKAFMQMQWREGALPYFIVITDVGFHEGSDGSECAEADLADVTELIEGNAMLTVVHAGNRGGPGVDPDWLVRAMGGLYVSLDGISIFSDFDVALDTPADDVLESTHVLRIPAGDATASASQLGLSYTVGGQTLTLDTAIAGG